MLSILNADAVLSALVFCGLFLFAFFFNDPTIGFMGIKWLWKFSCYVNASGLQLLVLNNLFSFWKKHFGCGIFRHSPKWPNSGLTEISENNFILNWCYLMWIFGPACLLCSLSIGISLGINFTWAHRMSA